MKIRALFRMAYLRSLWRLVYDAYLRKYQLRGWSDPSETIDLPVRDESHLPDDGPVLTPPPAPPAEPPFTPIRFYWMRWREKPVELPTPAPIAQAVAPKPPTLTVCTRCVHDSLPPLPR